MDMALSVVWVTMSMFLMSHEIFLIVHEPLRHNKWILRERLFLALIHEMVFA